MFAGYHGPAAITLLPSVLSSLLPVVAAFAASVIVLILLLSGGVRRVALDHPNERSLHSRPVPRAGGLAILAGMLAGWALCAASVPWAVVCLAALLGLVSFADDLHSLRARWRLLAHLATAAALCALYIESFPALAWLPIVWLSVGWMTNLYNFMDGSDGLAGGMALFGFGAYAFASVLAGDSAFAVVNGVVAAATAGFLFYNFPPARIFMGDVGSIPLGFLAAAFGLVGWARALWPAWFPVAIFAPFILDASVTLIRRGLRGEQLSRPHRSHYYQRLVLAGWSHRRLALAEYALMLATVAIALIALGRPPVLQAALLAALIAGYLLAGLTVDKRWRAQAGG